MRQGIRPLEQYPIKGIIWYQGESNAHNREAHEKLFGLLVESWRKNWENENLPLLLCTVVKYQTVRHGLGSVIASVE